MDTKKTPGFRAKRSGFYLCLFHLPAGKLEYSLNITKPPFLHLSKLYQLKHVHGLYDPFSPTTDFPGGSDSKASVYDAGDPGWISGLGRSLGEGNGNPLQYYCLENPMDRAAW